MRKHLGLSVFVVGTRAQLIKIAPVITCCEHGGQDVVLLLTGQHKETMQDLLEEFRINTTPERVVQVSERSTVLALVAWMPRVLILLTRRLKALVRSNGSVSVAVHGDTLSTLIGALAARLAGCRVFHVESGLSSGKLFDPFPEELTRRLVFRLTHVALCPGKVAALYMQSRHGCRVVDTGGNTIVDSVKIATKAVDIRESARVRRTPYLVVSLHRFQNIFNRDRLRFLAGLIKALGASFEIHFVLHPATRKRLESEGLLASLSGVPNLVLSPRLGYRDFLQLASGASCVLTDGGSNQEELAVLGVPTIVMREQTERADGLGRNAIMEGDINGDLLEFMNQLEFESLRQIPMTDLTVSPSAIVAAELAS